MERWNPRFPRIGIASVDPHQTLLLGLLMAYKKYRTRIPAHNFGSEALTSKYRGVKNS